MLPTRLPKTRSRLLAWRGSEGELWAAAQEDALEVSDVDQREAVEEVPDVEMPCDAVSGFMGWWVDPTILPTPSELSLCDMKPRSFSAETLMHSRLEPRG